MNFGNQDIFKSCKSAMFQRGPLKTNRYFLYKSADKLSRSGNGLQIGTSHIHNNIRKKRPNNNKLHQTPGNSALAIWVGNYNWLETIKSAKLIGCHQN